MVTNNLYYSKILRGLVVRPRFETDGWAADGASTHLLPVTSSPNCCMRLAFGAGAAETLRLPNWGRFTGFLELFSCCLRLL
jgi:hypothetical protein